MVARYRPARRLTLLLVLLLLLAGGPTTPTAAQIGTPTFSSTPGTIDLTVPLGTTSTTTLQLRNDSAAPLSPQLYTAFLPGTRPAAAQVQPAPSSPAWGDGPRIDPLIATAQAADPLGQAAVLVFMDSQADLTAAYGLTNWAERGQYVYSTLRAYAETSQRAVRAALQARGLAYTPLWIVNALAVRGNAADVTALAAQAHVAALRTSRVATLEAPPAQTSPVACAAGSDNACWNLALIGANRAWAEFGVLGEGITVANLDSGVRFEHPALINQYRGTTSSGVSHDYNWYDPYGNQPAPVDAGNHGTHTMGTMVAQGLSVTQPAVGVAPRARWIAVRACSTRECSEADLLLGAQWLLAPTTVAGTNPRPDLRPHVVNNSWTAGVSAPWFLSYVHAWRAAGIYPVFAAGNSGSLASCGSIQAPGNLAEVTAVGAVDTADRLTSFSSIGPTTDGRTKPDLTAPGQNIYATFADQQGYSSLSGTSMAAPHVAGAVALLWSANPTLIGDYAATYAALTSTAKPRIGDSRYLDTNHANCQPTVTPNNIYGYGRLDVYAALAHIRVTVPWLSLPPNPTSLLAPGATTSLSLTLDARMVPAPGVYQARVLLHGPDLSLPPTVIPVTLRVPVDPSHALVSGHVTRATDGLPLQATVQVVGGAAVLTDATGSYSLTLPPQTTPYRLIVSARDHQDATATVTLTLGAQVSLDFQLEADQPHLTADTTLQTVTLPYRAQQTVQFPISNTGSQPLTYTLSLPAQPYGVWRSDQADGPPTTWTDPPADAITVTLTEDGSSGALPIGFSFPFYQTTYTQFTLTANGLIMFQPPSASQLGFSKRCLPLAETTGPVIAPLHIDLDPTQPGARVSYAQLPAGLLVNWEHVPLLSDPSHKLSFQTLLLPDGRISLRYRTLGSLALSEMASVGLQRDQNEVQSLGCKADLSLADGLTIELRPQLPPSFWVNLAQPQGSVAPNTVASVPVTVRWAASRPFTGPPFTEPRSANLELRSNDPNTTLTRFTVRLTIAPAPYSLLLMQVFTR